MTGIVGEDTLPDGTMTPVPNGDVDFYTFTAPDTGNIRIPSATPTCGSSTPTTIPWDWKGAT